MVHVHVDVSEVLGTGVWGGSGSAVPDEEQPKRSAAGITSAPMWRTSGGIADEAAGTMPATPPSLVRTSRRESHTNEGSSDPDRGCKDDPRARRSPRAFAKSRCNRFDGTDAVRVFGSALRTESGNVKVRLRRLNCSIGHRRNARRDRDLLPTNRSRIAMPDKEHTRSVS